MFRRSAILSVAAVLLASASGASALGHAAGIDRLCQPARNGADGPSPGETEVDNHAVGCLHK